VACAGKVQQSAGGQHTCHTYCGGAACCSRVGGTYTSSDPAGETIRSLAARLVKSRVLYGVRERSRRHTAHTRSALSLTTVCDVKLEVTPERVFSLNKISARIVSSSTGHAIKRFNSFSRACDGLLSVCLELLGPVWSRPSKGATWPPRARYVARVALCQGGGWIALPHPRLMSKSRSRWPATFCARGRQPPVEKFGRLEHLAQKEHPKSDVWHPCIGGLSRRVHGSGQSNQLSQGFLCFPLQHTPGPHLLPGGAHPCVGPVM
jgi:hypothetical protein